MRSVSGPLRVSVLVISGLVGFDAAEQAGILKAGSTMAFAAPDRGGIVQGTVVEVKEHELRLRHRLRPVLGLRQQHAVYLLVPQLLMGVAEEDGVEAGRLDFFLHAARQFLALRRLCTCRRTGRCGAVDGCLRSRSEQQGDEDDRQAA